MQLELNYSILMSVYKKEQPEFLRESMRSMLNQTVKTDDFVLVCDGELTNELYQVINEFKAECGDMLHIVPLKENLGTGTAANIGLTFCKYDIVVKMDSDDVAHNDRCEKQLQLFADNPELAICGAYIQEFDSVTRENIAIRKTPSDNSAIHIYAKRRNPFNNQTLVLRKSVAQKIGGYSTIKRCEDYDFVARVLMSGAVGANIPEVLVDYRVTPENYQRRKNWANTKAFISVRWRLYKRKFSSFWDFMLPCTMQLFIFIMPSKLTGKIYKQFLR